MAENVKIELPEKNFFTTGEAASLCAVTPNAVLKWVAAGRLTANRTPGGHHRIPRHAVLELLKGRAEEKSGIPADLLGSKQFQYCWEFNADSGKIREGCLKCIVYRSRTGRCYEMASLPQETGHARLFCDKSCKECRYYEIMHGHTPNILLATDQPILQSELESQAKNTDYNVRFTDCEYKCSMIIESFRPDYVVIDCSIGPERSREFAFNLSEDPRIPYTRIILAGNSEDLPEECDHLVFAFITRPLSMTTLDELIRGLKVDS